MSERPGPDESNPTPAAVAGEADENSPSRVEHPISSRPVQPPLKTHRVIKLGQSSPPSAPSHAPPSPWPPAVSPESTRVPAAALTAGVDEQTPEAAPVSVHPVTAQSPISSTPPAASSARMSPTSSPVLSISYDGVTLDEFGEELADDELRELSPESTRVISSRPPPRELPTRASLVPSANPVHSLITPIPPSVEAIRPLPSLTPPPLTRSSMPPDRVKDPAIPPAPLVPTYAAAPQTSLAQPIPALVDLAPAEPALAAADLGQLATAPVELPISVSQAPRRMPVPPSRVQVDAAVEEQADDLDEADVPSIEPSSEQDADVRDAAAQDFEVPPAERKPPPPKRSSKPVLPQAQKARSKPWWETLFGDDFQRAYRPMTYPQLARETDFIIQSLALPRGSVLLDLGCGQGELCVELTRRGYSVVGYDLSVYQLAMAGDNAQMAGQKINFLQGDMREMAFDNMFDGILCWDTSFGYFEEDKNIEVLKRMRAALKPGGHLLLDILNRDFVGQQAPYNHWFEGDGCVCMDDMTMDWITNRLKVKRSIILDDSRSKELQYSIRVYSLSEIGRMLHEAGFRVAAVSGDIATRGAFFGPVSRRIIIEATKP